MMIKITTVAFTVIHISLFNNVVSENLKAGPYVAMMLNATRCEKPSRPYNKDPPVMFFAEVYNSTKKYNLIRGNITILKERADYTIKSKCYTKEDGKWKISLVLNSAGCRGVLLSIFTTTMGLRHDKDKCTLQKGTYNFRDVDTNEMEHAWASTKPYGVTKCRVEVSSGSHTAECWQFYETITHD